MLCQRTICHESNGCRVVLEERLLTRHKATFNAPMGGDSLPLDLSSMRKGQVRINSQASKDTGVWAQLYKMHCIIITTTEINRTKLSNLDVYGTVITMDMFREDVRVHICRRCGCYSKKARDDDGSGCLELFSCSR
nr:beta-galactosidase 3-like [Tanacetum cinerariifolium]